MARKDCAALYVIEMSGEQILNKGLAFMLASV